MNGKSNNGNNINNNITNNANKDHIYFNKDYKKIESDNALMRSKLLQMNEKLSLIINKIPLKNKIFNQNNNNNLINSDFKVRSLSAVKNKRSYKNFSSEEKIIEREIIAADKNLNFLINEYNKLSKKFQLVSENDYAGSLKELIFNCENDIADMIIKNKDFQLKIKQFESEATKQVKKQEKKETFKDLQFFEFKSEYYKENTFKIMKNMKNIDKVIVREEENLKTLNEKYKKIREISKFYALDDDINIDNNIFKKENNENADIINEMKKKSLKLDKNIIILQRSKQSNINAFNQKNDLNEKNILALKEKLNFLEDFYKNL